MFRVATFLAASRIRVRTKSFFSVTSFLSFSLVRQTHFRRPSSTDRPKTLADVDRNTDHSGQEGPLLLKFWRPVDWPLLFVRYNAGAQLLCSVMLYARCRECASHIQFKFCRLSWPYVHPLLPPLPSCWMNVSDADVDETLPE